MPKHVFASPTVNVVPDVRSENGEGYHSFILFNIDFVSYADEGKVLWISRRRLDQKLVFPIIQILK